MPENEPIRRFVPLPTQFLQEEEPSDTDEDDEQNEEYDQPLAHFQHPTARLTSAHDHRTQSFSSGRGISSDTFYGISQRNLSYGQNHGVEDDMSAQTLRSFMGRHIPKNDDCSQNSYEYQEVFDDPHQLIPSYHEYSITNSPTHSYSPTSGDSAGMPEYFISRGASTAMRSGGLGYASRTTEQGDTVFCESQQRLQEPKVISNESNRYTVVGHTVEGQPIYALQSVRTQDRPRLHQGSLYRVMENSAQPRYVFLRQQAGPARRLQRDVGDHNSSNENYRAVAREIVAKALEDKRQKQFSQESQPSSSGVSVIASKTRRRLVMPDDEESEKISGSTAAAQVAAIQRFSTPLGWKQMGSWLKTAEANEDWSRLKLLLSQCSQANLTLELLQSNDTPKFVRKLSKTCPDQDIRKVSGDLVVRWKRLISAPSHQVSDELKKVGSAKRKTPHPVSGGASKAKVKKDSLDSAKTVERESKLDGNKQKDACGNKMESNKKSPNTENSEKSDAAKAEKLMKTSSTKSKVEKTEKLSESTKSTSNKLNEFNMFEKLGEEGKEKKRRPKTAKTYTSKFRSTGFFISYNRCSVIVQAVLLLLLTVIVHFFPIKLLFFQAFRTTVLFYP
ncbi:unnamed protein product [Litomosoides sigmodontis]|uniref:TFIIS N-terminal domain-containing protein n=1 Tax=Litomosoides sigmodontis TaxID=42156 RepID=A0A3P6UUA8_LITSI|nr:unnamed protein product [Litomosoides sigmodontis]